MAGYAEDLLATASNLHYVEDLTQEEVARRLKLSRISVTRLLRKARDTGWVPIAVKATMPEMHRLALALEEEWGPLAARGVPSSRDLKITLAEVGRAGAELFARLLRPGCRIGVAGSRTVSAMLSWRKACGPRRRDFRGSQEHPQCRSRAEPRKGGLMDRCRFISMVTFALVASTATAQQVPPNIGNHKGQIKVAVIRNLGSDDHTNQFLAGAREEGTALGFKVDTFITNGEDARFQDYASQVENHGYDAVILSHGKDPYATDLVKKLRQKGLAVSVFDTALSGVIPGVTSTSQKDESLAEMSLGQLVADSGGKARFLKLWVAGFPPMERRQVVYKKVMQDNPGLKELELIGAVSADVQGDTANKVGAALTKYAQGQLDSIWGSWDAFAQGAYKALMENGRKEVKIYSIDVSNQDLQLMQEANSPWICTAAVDPKLIGRINMRLVAKKLAGEPTPHTYEFAAALIKQSDLKKSPTPVNMATLASIIPGWGESKDFDEPWMATLRTQHKK